MSAPFVSRSFHGRRQRTEAAQRLPGQYLVSGFPVLSGGPTPHMPLDQWGFTIVGEVDQPRRWTWDAFQQPPRETVSKDILCVTKWSKIDTTWAGVSLDALLQGVVTGAPRPITSWLSAMAPTQPICRLLTWQAAGC